MMTRRLLAACLALVLPASVAALVLFRGAQLRRLPPRANLAWTAVDTPHFRVLFDRWSLSARRNAARAALAAESSLAADLQLLESPPYNDRVTLILANSREHIAALSGRQALGWAHPGATITAVAAAARGPLLRHEIMHHLTTSLWGPPQPPGDWLAEGFAALATGTCAGFPPQYTAGTLLRLGQLPRLDSLISSFRRYPEMISYLAAGSIVQFVASERGTAGLQQLWRQGLLAFGSVESFERAWRDYLAAAPRIAWQPRDGCARGQRPA